MVQHRPVVPAPVLHTVISGRLMHHRNLGPASITYGVVILVLYLVDVILIELLLLFYDFRSDRSLSEDHFGSFRAERTARSTSVSQYTGSTRHSDGQSEWSVLHGISGWTAR